MQTPSESTAPATTPATTPAPVMEAFERSLAFVLGREGGYADTKGDRGGKTMRGVIQQTFDYFCERVWKKPTRPVRTITEAEVRAIYWAYFRDASCHVLAARGWPDLALAVHDCAINCGDGTARKLLQRAVGVTEDKIVGPATCRAIDHLGERGALARYLDVRALYYRTIAERDATQVQFIPSWLSRLRHTCRAIGMPIGPSYSLDGQVSMLAYLRERHGGTSGAKVA